MTLTFEPADTARDRETLLRYNIGYVDWIADHVSARFSISLTDLLGCPIPDYVEGALDKLCAGTPPEGVFYLVRREGEPVGMGGLRTVREGIAEMKRVYVSPEGRGGGTGAKIVERLIADAKSFGHREMWLDTAPFMTSAHRLYEAQGFTDIPAYPEVEVPEGLRGDWRFMGRAL